MRATVTCTESGASRLGGVPPRRDSFLHAVGCREHPGTHDNHEGGQPTQSEPGHIFVDHSSNRSLAPLPKDGGTLPLPPVTECERLGCASRYARA